jgi:hypothetical protein
VSASSAVPVDSVPHNRVYNTGMFKPLLQLTRRSGLIALMLFVLTGVQLLQASPLHDHAQHSVDCGLCHVPLADTPPPPHGLVPTFDSAVATATALATTYPSHRNASPYQGRAPPAPLL